MGGQDGERDIEQTMSAILAALGALLYVLHLTLTPNRAASAAAAAKKDDGLSGGSRRATRSSARSAREEGVGDSTWLADPAANPAKRDWEVFNLVYGGVWIGVFVIIVAFHLYRHMGRLAYMVVCGGLCLPILLQPLLFVCPSEAKLPLLQRYGTRANLWIAIYSFIGNYWYTHYFYCVLKASYSMPAWRLNDVPIQLYFATFFYFCFYHSLSNAALRKVVTTYRAGPARALFLSVLVLVMAYFTAFMETLTISSYPDYTFEDRDMAYKLGSAFYGIYFIYSFPMFYRFDEWPGSAARRPSLWETCVDSMGAGMAILTTLDVVRLYLGIQLRMPLHAP